MMIDVNAYLSRWPFRRLPCDETAALVERLDRWQVAQAWVGSFDGLFHRDLAGVNARLTAECRRHAQGRLVPFGSVNPRLPDWQEDVRRCHEDHGMRGIRLHPNYHGYTLNDPVVAELLDAAFERKLVVQLVVRMDDVRVQHPLMQVDDVDLSPLAALATGHRQLTIVVLNWQPATDSKTLGELAATGNVYFDVAMQEGVAGVARLLETVPVDRVLFGSHLPLFQLESAVLKLRESDLAPGALAAISHGNARRLLA